MKGISTVTLTERSACSIEYSPPPPHSSLYERLNELTVPLPLSCCDPEVRGVSSMRGAGCVSQPGRSQTSRVPESAAAQRCSQREHFTTLLKPSHTYSHIASPPLKALPQVAPAARKLEMAWSEAVMAALRAMAAPHLHEKGAHQS